MSYTLVATAKNEGPYLFEWVAYHRMIGFDNILIFQNDSDDFTHETLNVLQKIGAVEYRYNAAPTGRHQIRAYKRAARQPVYKQSNFVIALDLDEFLQIHVGEGGLTDLFAALPETDEILLNWRRFGHSGHRLMDDALVTERFTWAEADRRIVDNLTPYKAMFRPALFDRPGVHRPPGPKRPENEIRTCNGSGLPQDQFERFRFRSKDPARRSLAQVNHYMVRDAASFVLKSYRGSAHQSDRGIDKRYWNRRNFNDERDLNLANRAAQLKAAMREMNEQSGGRLNRLREKALRSHADRFEKLLQDPSFHALYAHCTEERLVA